MHGFGQARIIGGSMGRSRCTDKIRAASVRPNQKE